MTERRFILVCGTGQRQLVVSLWGLFLNRGGGGGYIMNEDEIFKKIEQLENYNTESYDIFELTKREIVIKKVLI